MEPHQEEPQHFQPGQTISPQAMPVLPVQTPVLSPPVPTVTPELQPIAVQPLAPTAPAPLLVSSPLPSSPSPNASDTPVTYWEGAPNQSISWTASEYIAHHKSGAWYALLALIAVVVAATDYLLFKDKVSTGVIVICAVIFGILAASKPRELTYQLDPSGLTIGQRHFPYGEFKSFSVVPEGAFMCIVFMPLRRFMPLITVYYDPSDEERIMDILETELPFDTHHYDPIDQLLRRIRF
jgi:hypothetical protein